MVVHIKVDTLSYDCIRVNTDNLSVEVSESSYTRYTDEKWIKHAKKHNFNPNKDCYNSKIWDQYLRLCAEGLI